MSSEAAELELQAWKVLFEDLLEKSGKNLGEFAAQIGKQSTTEEWVRGRHRPSPANQREAEKRLGMKRDELTVRHAFEILRLKGYLLDDVAESSSGYGDPGPILKAVRLFHQRDENFRSRAANDPLLEKAANDAETLLKEFMSLWGKIESSLQFSDKAN